MLHSHGTDTDYHHGLEGVMPATFTDEECYLLFIALDNRVRAQGGRLEEDNAIRERLLPFYADWHKAHPFEVHPSAYRALAASDGGRE